MKSINKISPGASGILQQVNRQGGQAPQLKSVVAQPKTGVSAQSFKRPVAPPVYRPQATPKAAQPKMAHDALNGKPPVAPPVFRPQEVPRVLQAKNPPVQSPSASPAPRQPFAPSVYRLDAKKLIQPKAISQLRQSPTAPPVYRPEQKRVAQPKMAAAAQAHTPPQATLANSTQPKGVNAPTSIPAQMKLNVVMSQANTKMASATQAHARPIAHRNIAPRVVFPGSSITALRSKAIQRTPEESQNIKKLGLRWNKIAEMDPKSPEKLEFFTLVKEIQEKLGFKVYTVWHKHDPYVGGGKNKNYVKIVKSLQGKDRGKTAADLYIKWATGETTIDKLPHELQELLIIVHIAEVGRMYLDAPGQLLRFMEIVSAADEEERVELWKQFKRFNPYALTAKEDVEYNPEEDEMWV